MTNFKQKRKEENAKLKRVGAYAPVFFFIVSNTTDVFDITVFRYVDKSHQYTGYIVYISADCIATQFHMIWYNDTNKQRTNEITISNKKNHLTNENKLHSN